MGAAFDESFKKRYRRNKEALEWYDALAMAVAVIAIVFTFFVRIVKVDGHSMDPTLFNGERILINLMKQPDYGDIVVVDGYTSYGKPLVKRVIGKGGEERIALQNKLTKEYGKTVIVNVIEVKSAATNAQLVAADIARQLENRVTFRRAMKQCMRLSLIHI